jgi:hypothetical protein
MMYEKRPGQISFEKFKKQAIKNLVNDKKLSLREYLYLFPNFFRVSIIPYHASYEVHHQVSIRHMFNPTSVYHIPLTLGLSMLTLKLETTRGHLRLRSHTGQGLKGRDALLTF